MEYPTISLNPCPPMALGYGNGFYNRDDNCDSLKAALHVTENIGVNTHRTDTNSGFRHTSDGQRELMKAVYDAENDVRTHLTDVNKSITNAEARLTNGQHDLSKEICDVSRDTLLLGGKLSGEIGDNKFYMSQIGSDIRREVAKESCDTRTEVLGNRFELIRGLGDAKLDACKNTNEIMRQSADNYAKTQLQISQSNADLAAKIAECCCETQKELLRQSASIRELDQKLSAQNEKLFLEQKISTLESQRENDRCRREDHTNNLLIQLTNINRNTQVGINT